MKKINQLKQDIESYQPINDLEMMDKKTILSLLKEPAILTREQLLYHITSSCWVMNEDHTKILMIYHNIYQSWSWMGGHNDGDANAYAVAKKELKEESGIENYLRTSPTIFSLEILPVFQHMKKKRWVASHLHLNLTYLFIVDDKEPLTLNIDETSGVKWINVSDLDEVVREKEMLNVYHKLLKKAKDIH